MTRWLAIESDGRRGGAGSGNGRGLGGRRVEMRRDEADRPGAETGARRENVGRGCVERRSAGGSTAAAAAAPIGSASPAAVDPAPETPAAGGGATGSGGGTAAWMAAHLRAGVGCDRRLLLARAGLGPDARAAPGATRARTSTRVHGRRQALSAALVASSAADGPRSASWPAAAGRGLDGRDGRRDAI